MPQRKFDLADDHHFSNKTGEEKEFYSQVKNEMGKRFLPGEQISQSDLVELLNDSMAYRVRAGFVLEVIDHLLQENVIEKVGDGGYIYEVVSLASKILPRNVICAPANTIPVACTEEELTMLILGRLKSALKTHGASYFTVDDYTRILLLLVKGRHYQLPTHRSLLRYLEDKGKVAIVPFSPADIYRIVDEPSPSPQTHS